MLVLKFIKAAVIRDSSYFPGMLNDTNMLVYPHTPLLAPIRPITMKEFIHVILISQFYFTVFTKQATTVDKKMKFAILLLLTLV